jgi:8-amino-7-oxononanoate synthase
MERHRSTDSLRSLTGYARRRLNLAGGSFLSDADVGLEPMEALRAFYQKPLDASESEYASAGRQFVSFANYDYLGLALDPRIKRAACTAIMETGIGVGASRLVGGERTIHGELERDLAQFLGVEDTLALVSGYLTNVSLVGHLLTSNDLVIVDELSHNSIMVGTGISRGRISRFAHNDLDHLDALLKRHRGSANRALVVVEGLYSMDGDIPDLPRLLEIRDKYGAWLMVDEAHSLGVLGRNGRGITEHFGVDAADIDLLVGTLSKTLGACGGFIAGRKDVIDWLRFTLPGFVFSVGLSPAIAAAVREAIAVLREEPWRVKQLRHNSTEFLERAKSRGLNTGGAIGAGVVPILLPTQDDCMRAALDLLQAGFYAPPILKMAVPKDKPRIRFFISTLHTAAQIEEVLRTLELALDGSRPSASGKTHSRRSVALRHTIRTTL